MTPTRTVSIGLLLLALAAAPAKLAAPSAPPKPSAPMPRFVRTIVLVRHGLYNEDDPLDTEAGLGLTDKGRAQVRLAAHRLAQFPLHIDVLRSSTMTRARETAAIFADSLPGLVPIASKDLCECTPPTDRADILAEHTPGDLDSCRQQMDRGYAMLFRPSPLRDSTEVVAGHGNLTRYFLCKALGIDPLHWLHMGTQNASFTIFRVRTDSTVQLMSFNDYGHLPPELATMIRPTRADSVAAPAGAKPGSAKARVR